MTNIKKIKTQIIAIIKKLIKYKNVKKNAWITI